MYSVKGKWVGQTFALATTNESGAKKSRIRRSKEERKSMVESFIKRYQSSNNGNFPSLNLTHKEVGGSFYTVREIVREIIQENRVLGPGQFCCDDQKEDSVSVDYPLGTISSEPQGVLFHTSGALNGFSFKEEKETVIPNFDNNGHLAKHFDFDVVLHSTENQSDKAGEDAVEVSCKSISETIVIPDNHEEASLEASLNINGHGVNVKEMLNVCSVNHMQTNETPEKSDNLSAEGSPERETLENGELERSGAVDAILTLLTEEVQVETFPLRPEPNDLGNASIESRTEKVKLSNITLVLDKDISFDSSSDLVMIKEAESFEASVSGGNPDMMIQHEEVNPVVVPDQEVNLKNETVDMQDSFPIKDNAEICHNCVNQLSSYGDSTAKTAEESNLQRKNASNGITYLEDDNGESLKRIKEPALSGNDMKRNAKATVRSSPPLDRIDLGKWKASKQENNPLLALIKAFVDAFVRLWE